MLNRLLRSNLLFFFLLLLLISSCAVSSRLSKEKKETLLKKNLTEWQNFSLEGLIELNYKAFSFRKNIVIKKNEGVLRLDILDSGLMGLSPAPFMSAYLDSSLILRLPGNSEFTEISSDKLKADLLFLDYLRNTQQLLQFKDEIIAAGQVHLADLKITWSDEMQITEISQTDKEFIVQFFYAENLSEIVFLKQGSRVADILIDKITFSKSDINKLNP